MWGIGVVFAVYDVVAGNPRLLLFHFDARFLTAWGSRDELILVEGREDLLL